MGDNVVIPTELLESLVHRKDIWQLRAYTLAAMYGKCSGLPVRDILEGDKEYVLQRIIQESRDWSA